MSTQCSSSDLAGEGMLGQTPGEMREGKPSASPIHRGIRWPRRESTSLIYLLAILVVHALLLGRGPLSDIVAYAYADSVSYGYDGLGRVIQATDSTTGHAVFYSYDSAGNITSQQVVPIATLA